MKALLADRLQVPRHSRIEPPRRHRLITQDLEHRVHRRRRLERRTAGDHRVERGSERVHVCGRPNLTALARGLLRRHIAGRPHDLPRTGQATVNLHPLGEAEVGHPRVLVGVD